MSGGDVLAKPHLYDISIQRAFVAHSLKFGIAVLRFDFGNIYLFARSVLLLANDLQ